jgi:hypothetical protein
MPRKKEPVSFHDDPPDARTTSKYKEALARAKSTQRERPGDLAGTQRFDQTTAWKQEEGAASDFLSDDSKRGLEAMAKTAKREEEAKKAGAIKKDSVPPQKKKEDEEEVEAVELTQDEKLREAIEKRITPIDIGEYLMNGEVKQTVPVIPDKLVVVFRTVSDLEEGYVDTEISKESSLSNRQFLRKMNEFALATHIHSVNGSKWPPVIDGDGNINEESMEHRLRHIRKLSSPIFNMLTQNLGWFVERVSDSLTAEALGNG